MGKDLLSDRHFLSASYPTALLRTWGQSGWLHGQRLWLSPRPMLSPCGNSSRLKEGLHTPQIMSLFLSAEVRQTPPTGRTTV